MKTTIKYISIAVGSTLILGVGALFVPPVTKVILEKSLIHFLEVNASVQQAVLSIHGLQASGTLNKEDHFTVDATTHSFSKATVRLHYIGDVHTFSKVATVELPYIKTTLDANLTTEDLLLKLKANLLQGTLSGSVDLNQLRYDYNIDKIDLSSFRTQQRTLIPNYASGQLSVVGKGIIEAPYSVDFLLESHDLKLEHNATMLISSELNETLPLSLNINGVVSAEDLNTTLTVDSSLLDLNVSTLYYDFNQSDFQLVAGVKNYQQTVAPLQQLALDLNGTLKKEQLQLTYFLTVDEYRLKTEKLTYDLNQSKLDLDYHLSSLKKEPLNLQNEYALFGHVNYQDKALRASLDSKAIDSPTVLTLQEDQLHIISNNINLQSFQKIANQEVVAKGHLFLEADANLSSEPLLWKAKLQSKDLQLPWKYRKDVGLKNNLVLTINANSDHKGDIIVHPTLWSNIGIINYTGLLYKPTKELLYFNLNAKKIKTSYYKAPKLNIKGSLNLKKSHLNKTILKTPYEEVVINALDYSDKGITSQVAFALARLDRFGSLNPAYKLSGNTSLNYTPEQSLVTLDSKELGHLDLEQKGKVLKLAGDHLALEQLSSLLNQPTLMHGDLDYSLRYSASSIKASIHAPKISGEGDLNSSIRPFSLDFSTALKYNKKRYHGAATLNTDNEHFKISNVVVDLSKQQFKSRYKLEIDKLENNTFILPQELKGPLHVSGKFEQNKFQYVTLKLVDFQLPKAWHQKLDPNATSYLETNASVLLYNDKGLVHFDADISNNLLRLVMSKSDYNLKTGAFNLHTDLETDLWLKDTNISTQGVYKKEYVTLSQADVSTANETVSLHDLRYILKDQNLTTKYELRLKPYPNAPYHSNASINGEVKTKPELYATMQSKSLGGKFDAYVTNTDLHLVADDVSVDKLLKFTGQEVPINSGTIDAKIDMHSPTLLDANLSTLKGRSDINITDMTLEGVELDSLIKTLRDSQDLNLFQGSFGNLPIVRSVKDLPSDITEDDANSTQFGKIRFLTDVNATGLHCKDCAIATEENLIVIKGGINLDKQTFDEMYVGMLFPNNCAYFIQQVDGNLSEPQVKLAAAGFKVIGGATMSLIGNLGSVVDLGADVIKGTGSVVGGAASYVPVVGEKTDKALTTVTDAPKSGTSAMQECIPFYTGVVKHPKPKTKSILSKQSEKIEKSKRERQNK